MAPPPQNPSGATVTDLATARRDRASKADTDGTRAADPAAGNPGEGRQTARKAPRKVANRRFDTEKVERLKAEIADGRYTIDADRVANRFIEHERNN